MSISTNNNRENLTKDAMLCLTSQPTKTSLRHPSPPPLPSLQITSMQTLTAEEDPTVSTRIGQKRPLTRHFSARSVECSDEPDLLFSNLSGACNAAMIKSIRNGKLADLQQQLAVNDFNVNRRINGRYALHYAADYGQYAIIEFLLGKDADIDCEDDYGITPLLVCIWEGYVDCVELLLANGATSHGITPDGKTFEEVADKEEIRKLLKAYEVIPDDDEEQRDPIKISCVVCEPETTHRAKGISPNITQLF